MPHADSEAGIGLRFNHPPFAYAKKSSPGLMDVSISATRTSGLGAGCGWGLAQPARIAATHNKNRRCMKRGLYIRPAEAADDADDVYRLSAQSASCGAYFFSSS